MTEKKTSIWFSHSFGFAIYSAASDRYQDVLLRTGLPTGTPQEALDTACTVHLADLEPLRPPDELTGPPGKVTIGCQVADPTRSQGRGQVGVASLIRCGQDVGDYRGIG